MTEDLIVSQFPYDAETMIGDLKVGQMSYGPPCAKLAARGLGAKFSMKSTGKLLHPAPGEHTRRDDPQGKSFGFPIQPDYNAVNHYTVHGNY